MVLKARIRVRHAGCVTERLSGGARGAQVTGDRDGECLVLHGTTAQVEEFVAEITRAQGVAPEILTRTESSVVLRGRHLAGGVAYTIQSHGCTVLWPALFHGGREQYTLVAPNRARLDGLVKSLSALGEAKIEKVVDLSDEVLEHPVTMADLTGNLTQRQLSVLRRAIEAGYYESPRRTSAEALAQSFGLSRSTLDEHLRKAESRVLDRFAAVLRAHPTLEQEPARGLRHASVASAPAGE